MPHLNPRNYQLESIERAHYQNLLIADDCGLGKTLTAIEIARNALVRDEFPRALIVCPKKLREQWAEQIYEQTQYSGIYIIDATPYDLTNVYGWFIIHYDALVRATYLNQRVWTVIVADEAHRLRNKGNKWTKAIKRLSTGRKIAMTATPMDKYPSEYWSLLDFLGVKVPLFRGFKARYETWEWHGPYPTYKGPAHLEELQSTLKTVMVKHTKQQVAPELPEHIIIKEIVSMSEMQETAFKEIDNADDIIVPVEGINDLIIKNALVKLVRLQQMGTDPSLLEHPAPSGKIEWLNEFLDDHPDQKIVIFTKWRHTALCLAETLASALVVGGQEPRGLDEFKKGDQHLLVGTIAGMGLGLDLPMATYSVFLDMEWSTLQMQQAYDRIHRMNITEPKVTYLLMANRVDRLIYKAVQHKWSEIELIQAFLHGD